MSCFALYVTVCFFFFSVPATTEIYTLSLHDALPICATASSGRCTTARPPRALIDISPAVPQSWYPVSTTDRKSTRLNSSHVEISYAVFCLKKKKKHADKKLLGT